MFSNTIDRVRKMVKIAKVGESCEKTMKMRGKVGELEAKKGAKVVESGGKWENGLGGGKNRLARTLALAR